MGNVIEKFEHIEGTRIAIKDAIIAKGVAVPSGTTFREYAEKVGLIPAKDDISGAGFLVRYIDFDGTVLKQQKVLSGQNATPPTPPTHEYLTFNKWKGASTGITYSKDIGAVYDTTDTNKTYVFITVNSIIGLSPTIKLNRSNTNLITIDWGDGQTSTNSTTGTITLNHTYSVSGDYVITIDCSAYIALGGGPANGGSLIVDTGNYTYAVTKLYIGSKASTNKQSFLNFKNLEVVSTGLSTGSILGVSCFENCFSLRCFIEGYDFTGYDGSCFKSCYSLTTLIVGVNFIPDSMCMNNYSLTKIILSVAYDIGINSFSGCYAIKDYLILALMPPSPASLANINAFTSISPLAKIYVPDEYVDAYKAATNWVTYANYIYPLSTRP